MKYKKSKILATLGLVSLSLTSCSNTQMAERGRILIDRVEAVGAYNWISDSEAETALDVSQQTLFDHTQKIIYPKNSYQVVSITMGENKSEMVAKANCKNVKVVVEAIGNNQSKIYIGDGRGKYQAQILLNQITKGL